MNIALIGYGRMGKEIESLALTRGHTIGLTVDKENESDLNESRLKGIDVAFEFTTPGQALANITKCLKADVSVVSGTTGWLKDFDAAVDATLKSEAAFLYASNFSVGVNIMFYLNMRLAELMRARTDYRPSVEEIHHIHKLDAPSGTALSLAKGIMSGNDRIKGWKGYISGRDDIPPIEEDELPVCSKREGEVPGTHIVSWESEEDILSLSHQAKGRQGFAKGAVLAAEFINGKSGVISMRDMLGF